VITGELKSKIDRIWDAFWSGGISNPLEVIEQITYLLFIRRLDDLQTLAENRARRRPAGQRPTSIGRQPVSTNRSPHHRARGLLFAKSAFESRLLGEPPSVATVSAL